MFGSAICRYSYTALEAAFNGAFLEENDNKEWVETDQEDVPARRPGSVSGSALFCVPPPARQSSAFPLPPSSSTSTSTASTLCLQCHLAASLALCLSVSHLPPTFLCLSLPSSFALPCPSSFTASANLFLTFSPPELLSCFEPNFECCFTKLSLYFLHFSL